MTRQQFETLFANCLSSFEFEEFVEKTKNKILASGAVNLDAYDHENSPYALPKAMLHAIFLECAFQIKPLTKEGLKEAKRLAIFT